jgi:hypothetical protein
MARSRSIGILVALAITWLGVAGTSGARSDEFKIIVHPHNPVTSISRAFLHDAFMKRTTRWSHGDAIRPVDLPQVLPVRYRFTTEVLDKTPAQLRSYWLQRIFSGTDVPPPEVNSTSAAIAYVVANEGAVTYLPADADPGHAKVIPVR